MLVTDIYRKWYKIDIALEELLYHFPTLVFIDIRTQLRFVRISRKLVQENDIASLQVLYLSLITLLH